MSVMASFHSVRGEGDSVPVQTYEVQLYSGFVKLRNTTAF